MRLSRLFSQTLREAPADAEVASHQLLLRAGYIRQLGAGIFSYLPLARRAMNKIEAIMREEINAIGGQEITMPLVHPAEIWKETGRWGAVGSEMGRFKDKADHDMALAMTHEEVATDLARREIRSYRQLPQLVYHIRTKWRDDPRPRAGLICAREFTMLDSYSFDADWDGLDRQYQAHYRACFRIFERCGLPVIAVGADTGVMGGTMAHEYMYLTPIGEDMLLLCDACGHKANRQVARFRKLVADATEPPRSMEKVATPGVTTIEALAAFLNIPKSKTAKAVFMVAEPADSLPAGAQPIRPGAREFFVFAVVRGDMDVNETKLARAVQARSLRPATVDEIHAIGAEPGYGSPVGVRGAYVVVDDAIPNSPSLVAGANEAGYHLLNVACGRDYQPALVCDIAAAQDGDACPECGAPLRASRGVKVGNIFKLGARYSEAMGASFLDKDGKARPLIMGSYGIGVGRLLACIAEEHHDEYGLKWPVSVAPCHVHLVSLRSADGSVEQTAGQIYAALWADGVETLWDDRDERPGVKFNDADLIGLPLRITVSERTLKAGGVEFKRRGETESLPVAVDTRLSAIAREWVSPSVKSSSPSAS